MSKLRQFAYRTVAAYRSLTAQLSKSAYSCATPLLAVALLQWRLRDVLFVIAVFALLGAIMAVGVWVWFRAARGRAHPEEQVDIPYEDRSPIAHTGEEYEHRDIQITGVIAFVVVLILGGILVHLFIYFYFRREDRAAKRAEQGVYPIVRGIQQQPPEPRLQTDPVGDLNRMREEEDHILNRYGWMDEAHTRVRIPIERAIQIVAQRGLPARTGPAPVSEASVQSSASGPDQPGQRLGPPGNIEAAAPAPGALPPAARPGGRTRPAKRAAAATARLAPRSEIDVRGLR